jgi:hypothetical protein
MGLDRKKGNRKERKNPRRALSESVLHAAWRRLACLLGHLAANTLARKAFLFQFRYETIVQPAFV